MAALLSMIQGPESLKQLTDDQLYRLASEIRALIIETVASTGGHLASNLGAVELTLALHYVFDAPRDKIIWDVGHQAYTHKLITGRRDRFHTLRQYGGLAGFCKRSESIYDVFDAGHSSTSISAALGFVEARDLKGEDHEVVAVIGDGSLTAGMAFEGLNQAGHLGKKMIVVLNDNEFSIASNVGALSAYLSRLLSGQFYTTFRRDVLKLLKTIPGWGEQMAKVGAKLEDAARSLVSPGMLFEELGFKYLGPIKGHNIRQLIRAFQTARQFDRPVLVHVVTKKGKGYPPSEQNPVFYHGVGAFDPVTGKPRKKAGPPDFTKVFGEAIVELAEEDETIVGITAAMPGGTGLELFAKRFPERFYDVGIAEQHAVTFAAGLACEGFKPVAAIYSTFLQRGFDQILHDVCLQNLPVTFALDRAGLVGEDGPTHHGAFDLSYLRLMPNMVIMAPKDENELGHMLKTALEHPGPAALRYPRGQGVGVERERPYRSLPVGKAELLRPGRHLALWACGSTVWPAFEAAETLSQEGIEAAVVNARFVKPLDHSLLLEQARQMGFIVTVEENALAGGFGSAVLEVLQTAQLFEVFVHRIGLPDRFIEHGSLKILRQKYGLDAGGIAESVRQALKRWEARAYPHVQDAAG
jgi:1-deoxy-D-xylulose-5-phosphate synthase